MTDERLAWLLDSASRLTAGLEGRISVRSILRRLDINVEKVVEPDAKPGSGAVRQKQDGAYYVVIRRSTPEPCRLSPRERFTLAHELGHILLCERYGWNPLTGSEYYKCEDCCDRFAAHLLVPEAAMEAMTFSTAKDAFTAVSQLSQIYSVSLEVASRRIVERIKHVGFFQAQEKTNSKQQPVLALDWGASSIAHLRLTPGLYLNEAHPLGGVVLLQRKKPCDEEVLVTEFGTACGRFRNNRWFLALRER